MAKKSETLTQRNKAQRDLIELKKMQAGELEPGPKPSEQAVAPKTFKEKRENFFYHYKYVVMIGLFIAVVAVVLIVDLAKRVDYDSKVVVFSYDATYSSYSEKISDYFEQFYTDINENGKVDIAAIDCSVDPNDVTELRTGKLTRLHSMLSVEDDALIFLIDQESLKHFTDALDTELFKQENMVPLSDDFYEFIKIEGLPAPDTKLYAAVREVDGTAIEGKNKAAYEAAKLVLEALRTKNGEQ